MSSQDFSNYREVTSIIIDLVASVEVIFKYNGASHWNYDCALYWQPDGTFCFTKDQEESNQPQHNYYGYKGEGNNGESWRLGASASTIYGYNDSWQHSDTWDEAEAGFVIHVYYYSSTLGRWLSRDPIEEKGGMNLYGFVNNDPVNFIDFFGLLVLPPVAYEDADELLGPSWAKAVAQSSITKVLTKVPCGCSDSHEEGQNISDVSVTVRSVVTKLRGVSWNEKTGTHGLSIKQHEDRHVEKANQAGKSLEDILKKLIGRCRSPKCLSSTEDYANQAEAYSNVVSGYKNALFDVLDYPKGVPQESRRQDAGILKKTMSVLKLEMDKAETKMKEDCTK